MKEKFLSLLASGAVRKAAYALVLAVLSALGYSQFGCAGGQLKPEVQAKLDVLACQIEAVEPLVGDLDAAKAIVLAARAKAFDEAVALALGLGADVEAVAKAFDACLPQPEPLPADAGVIKA